MKDKEKQIEEMGKVMPEKIKDPLDNSRYIIFGKSLRREIARIYYNAGYRKLPEDSVVLSKGAYESLSNKAKANVVNAVEIRKETAEKILNEVLQEIFYHFDVQSVKELNEKSLLASTMTFDVVTDKIFEIATREGFEIKE